MKINRIRTMDRRTIAAGALLLLLAAVSSWGALGISVPLYVGNTEPLQDEFGRPMRGSPSRAAASFRPRVEIRVAYLHPFYQVYTNLPLGTNGASSPYNPLVTESNQYNPQAPIGTVPADSIGGMGLNASTANSGLFCLVFPKRPATGLHIFARAYNAPTPEEATFYVDSDVVRVDTNTVSVAFSFGALKALNPADSDGDGLDDSWEALLGIDDRDTPDYDGDGMSDLHEMLAGTAADDPNSKLEFTLVKSERSTQVLGEGEEPPRQVRVRWQSVPGKKYQIQYVPALAGADGAAPEFVTVAPPDFVTVPVLGNADGIVTAGEGQYGMDMWVEVGDRFTGTFRVRLVHE